MTEIVLMKSGGALVPVDDVGVDYVAKLKTGAGVRVKVTRHNNVGFHRKMFSLLNLAFDAWDAPALEYKGQPVAKNIDQFRDDLTILAGHFESAIRLDGSIRFTAKSWSFAKMPDEEKEKLYSAIIDVVLAKILTNYTRPDLDATIEKLMGYT